ncbi:MAG: S8 family serine peptidase [Candidatus Eisenbacteria bacterium]
MRARSLPRRLRPVVWTVLSSFLLQPVFGAASLEASIRYEDSESTGRAQAIAPIDGEQLGEGEARFACELPTDVSEAWIVAAAEPFDAARWISLPEGGAFHRADASSGLVSLDALGMTLVAPTPIWWTVATVSKTTGRLRVTPVHSFTALPRFRNRVAASPYLLESRRGLLGAADKPAGATTAANAAPRIRLAAGFDFAPVVDGAPALPLAGTTPRVVPADPATADAPRPYLVQFSAPPADAERAALARAGGVVVAYVPDQAYLVRMAPSARARYEAEGRALWIGDYQPAYKMSPLLTDASVPVTGQYFALLFPDADARQVAAALGSVGATVEAVNDNGVNKILRFRAPAAGLADVAGLSEVAWVEPVAIKTVSNSNAAWVVQTNTSLDYRVWNMGLRGLGQVVMTSDSGIDVTHNMFRDPAVAIPDFGDYPTHRKIIAYKRGSTSPAVDFGDHGGANTFHGSHTAGTMVGNDSLVGGTSLYDGMAKDAKIYFMDLSGAALANSVVPFDDLNDLFLPPYTGNAGGAARISSNSWGSAVNGAYDLNAMQIDQFVWAHPDMYIGFSNGNSGSAGTVGSPATAKNLAGMGGVRNGPSQASIYTATSRGPTADGRRKPLFCAPGQSVVSAQSGPANYASLSGTSMACPSGTGAVVLMRQYLSDGWYPTGAPVASNAFSPSAALLKAMAINAADNGVTGFTAPDNNIGYGRIKIDNVLYFPGDARKLLLVDNTDGLGQGQYIEYQVNVTETTQPLEISLCWSDYPGNPTASVQLVNNLDLTVTNGISTYKGNYFTGGVSVTGGSADNLNVEENVLVAVPTTGLYTIRVAAPAVPIGPQPFGLCVTGGVGQTAGVLALDRAVYGSSSTMKLQVTDTNAGGSVQVKVTSTTEPAGETITLTGTNGVLNGTLPLTLAAPTAANGQLSVSSGDALTATYVDASPAGTLTANASVSFANPVITNVKATSQGASGTLITFNTNLNAVGRVYYGLTPGLELGSVTESGAPFAHQVLLTGLTPGATYYYDVEATSLLGNVVRDDLGGTHYRFTAKGSGDLLLVVGEAGYPRLGAWEDALKTLNYDYDKWIGPLADHPVLGDTNSGLRSYRAVLWQVGIDQYPPFSDEQRTAVTNYLNGGGRLATFGHDIGWALGDLTSGYATGATQAWLSSTLKTVFNADPTTWSTNTGIAADPISGAYVGGVAYEPVRAGGAGDEVDIAPSPGGPASYTWRDTATPDDIAFRWESATPSGTPGTALWAGLPTRLANQFFEWTAVDPPYSAPSSVRNDIADKTILWLLGRPRPSVAVTAPNGGEVLSSNGTSITWSETIGGGYAAAARTIEYSLDGGDSWTLLTSAAGPSPYAWDLTTVPNSTRCLVRVRVTDNGAPGLAQGDVSNATFTIVRAGGDVLGPVVVAGSIAVSPNPIVRPNPVSLTASVSDVARGGSNIAAAEWSFGDNASLAGLGQPLTLGGAGASVGVSGTLDSTPFSSGSRKLWVRAQDSAGNWGPPASLTVQVNGLTSVDAPAVPRVAFLAQNTPNPFGGGTSVRFGLHVDGPADLAVYSVQGRLVKRLASGPLPAGEHAATWDGRDDAGRRTPTGMYYYRLVTREGTFEKRMLLLP